ncbi:hypothetical protein [Thermosulfurimonas sp. F29]|uniref:hypothetical protein n=1 Tax=Thermosulfurimonas sp. F29 TaxID=2867247 RepID=UPI001C828466|nr:hypothetical protein [Thermosulfurimonas sp. F29]MBX6423279.1 hypothetical protein [Thermosulfurimonas sp. F29]
MGKVVKSFRVEEYWWQALKDYCNRAGKSLSETLSEAIAEYLARHQLEDKKRLIENLPKLSLGIKKLDRRDIYEDWD